MKPKRRPILVSAVTVVILVSLVVSGGLAATRSVSAQEGTPIDSCTTITSPGEYTLTGNVTSNTSSTCIGIRASDVVLDGNGYAVENDVIGVKGTGVSVRSQRNVTVENLVLKHWGAGVEFDGTADSSMSEITATHNGNGILLRSSDRNTLVDNRPTRNGEGVNLTASDDNRLRNTTASRNTEGVTIHAGDNNSLQGTVANDCRYGVRVYSGNGTTLTDTVANGHLFGVVISDESTDNVLTNTTANWNDQTGVAVSSGNRLINTTASDNYDFDIEVGGNNTLVDTTANGTGNGYGIVLDGDGNVLRDTVAAHNHVAVRIDSNDNTLTNTTADDNNHFGIQIPLGQTDGNELIHTSANDNYGGGVVIRNASDTMLMGVTANDSHQNGISASNARNLTLVNTTASDNRRTGISLTYVNESTIRNAVADRNDAGIRIVESHDTTLEKVIANANEGSGISSDGVGIDVIDATADSNREGIVLGDGRDNTVRNTTVDDNDRYGLSLGSATNGTVASVSADGNARVGISLALSSNSSVTESTVTNSDRGIVVAGSSNDTFANDTAVNNRRGIVLEPHEYVNSEISSDDNTITNTTVTGSAVAGITLNGTSAHNLVYDNRLNNTVNVAFGENFTDARNAWNVSKRAGRNVVVGPTLGGNYYAKPDGTGVSQTCGDGNGDGICDRANHLGGTENNTDFLPLTTVVGTGDLTASPSSIDFGAVALDNRTTATVTVRNKGASAREIRGTIGGPNASDFDVTNGSSSFRIGPHERRNVTVAFAPATRGNESGVLVLQGTSADRQTVTVALRGRTEGTKAVFPKPLTITSHGVVLFKLGPPRDLDGDGRYEDVTGDGRFSVRDVVAFAVVENAYRHDHLDLNDRQVAAFDFDHDGTLTRKDVVALARDRLLGSKRGRRALSAILGFADLDHDGKITRHDLRLARTLLGGGDVVESVVVR